MGPIVPTPLPGGLLLRGAAPGDRDALVELHSSVHAGPDGAPNTAVGQWIRDLFDRGHPTASLDEMVVVEDIGTGVLASSLMMVPQTWSYDGIPFGVGRVELVASHPAYRGRGLLARQLEVLHERSAHRGDVLQALTDLMFSPGKARYWTALTQRAGRGGLARDLPSGTASLRPATGDDIPFLLEVDRHARGRMLLSCVRNKAQWRHELTGRTPGSMVHDEIFLVEYHGIPAGYVVLGYGGIPSYPIPPWWPGIPVPEPVISVSAFELAAGMPWHDVVPGVLQRLCPSDVDGYVLWLGTEHPAYEVLGESLTRKPQNIGWFLRMPDVDAFLRHIAPVLENRLVGTAAEAYTGELLLHFYTYGTRLVFERGKLVDVSSWAEHSRRGSDASLPEQMFLQLLLGHASWPEIAPAFPDCRLQNRTAGLLIPVLFPRKPSAVWPLI
ncbi:GNAT family N-acetyltransferase [Allokutzneria sp. A3M-2-11 16]|uniref:GNAT family N-acetyltransferase n=1 Tax=Allokutzneria sp. A3M-2-11 16 TaxID=2962043 RepID=UPI0020B7460C|nr:GNAT family N-acetyltransferase [Allokutzneria sp. A3M-2-11 16]MCP3800647.1 GNAT family N-acetyltransferase [Allokutzneria sp. A3M-2-11 16]